MSRQHKPFLLRTALVAALVGSAAAQEAESGTARPAASVLQTQAGQQIPAGAFGVVFIETPRQASLLQLRGLTGQGEAILRDGDSTCRALAVRFVAGDFAGGSVTVGSAGPVRLILQSARVAEALARGEDIVSDMYRIAGADEDPDADIIVHGGLGEGQGFVINPGRSFLADLLGADIDPLPCREL